MSRPIPHDERQPLTAREFFAVVDLDHVYIPERDDEDQDQEDA
ncbi:hypothetical protein [Streptomyces decoyicus]